MKLNNAQDAIKQAIEGGYDRTRSGGLEAQERILFCLNDPLFWQSLGKARGWAFYSDGCGPNDVCRAFHTAEWLSNAKEWFETRMNQEDETKFWSSLP